MRNNVFVFNSSYTLTNEDHGRTLVPGGDAYSLIVPSGLRQDFECRVFNLSTTELTLSGSVLDYSSIGRSAVGAGSEAILKNFPNYSSMYVFKSAGKGDLGFVSAQLRDGTTGAFDALTTNTYGAFTMPFKFIPIEFTANLMGAPTGDDVVILVQSGYVNVPTDVISGGITILATEFIASAPPDTIEPINADTMVFFTVEQIGSIEPGYGLTIGMTYYRA